MNQQEVQVAPVEQEQATEILAQAPERVTTALTEETGTDVTPTSVEAVTMAPVNDSVNSQSLALDLFQPDLAKDLNIAEFFMGLVNTKVEYTGAVGDSYARMAASILGENPDEYQTEQDIRLAVERANTEIKNARIAPGLRNLDSLLDAAETPEETLYVLEAYQELKKQEQQTPYLHEISYAAVEKMYPLSREDTKQSLEEVKHNLYLAADLNRMAGEIYEKTSAWNLFVDFAEMLSPTAALSETISKKDISESDSFLSFFSRGKSAEALADLIEKMPPENRQALLQEMVKEIDQQETYLFFNDNSLFQAEQIQNAANILSNGIVAGQVADDENLWSTIDALTGFTGFAASKGIKGIVRAFKAKVAKPDLFVDSAVKYRGQGVGRADFDGGNRGARVDSQGEAMPVIDRPAKPVEAVSYNGKIISVQQAERQLENLKIISSGKLQRGDRKVLDAERKSIGDKISRLLSKENLELVAEKFIARGASRKNALRMAKKEVDPELQELQQQRQWLNDTIRQSDGYARAEAEASRLSLALQTQRMFVDPDSLGDTARGTIETIRPNTGKMVQLEMNANPQAARIKYSGFSPDGSPNLRKLVEQGLTPDDVAQRAMPSMGDVGELKYTLFNPVDVADNVRDMSSALQVTTIENRVLKEGKEVEKNSGGTLSYRPGNTLWRQNDDRESVGDFQLFFGSGDGGFESPELARMAGNNVFGEQLEAVEIGGEWYLRKDFRHYVDARYDSTPFDINQISGIGQWAKLFMNPLRLIGEGSLKEAWGALEASKAIALNVLKPAQDAIKKLSNKQKMAVSKLLYKGDSEQKVFTREEAYYAVFGEIENGKTIDDVNKIYDAYLKSRKVFDTHYEVLNQSVRNRMSKDGFKTIDHPNGTDSLYARAATSAEINDADTIFDFRTGQPLSPKQVEEINQSADGVTIVRSTSPTSVDVKALDGSVKKQTFDMFVVPNSRTGPLPQRVLNKRVGHVTRSYTDRKWKVVEDVTEIVNGKPRVRKVTRAIMRLEGEANKIRSQFVVDGKYADENLSVVRTRENPDDDLQGFVEDLEHIGYGSNNARTRGELLVGNNGNAAAIADPLEALAQTQFRLQREIGSDVISALRERFMKTFGEYLAPGTNSFPRGDIPFAADVPSNIQNKMKRMQEYIKGHDGLEKGVISKVTNNVLEAFEEGLFRYFNKKLPSISKLPRSFQVPVDGDLQRAAMKFPVYAWIIGRTLFQVPTNMLQVAFIASRYPVQGTVSIARSIFVFSALAARNSKDFPNMWKLLAKTAGYDEPTMSKLLEIIDESGIIKSTGAVDDFLGTIEDGMVNFGRQQGIVDKVVGGVKTVGGAPFKYPLRVSAAIQEKSINFVNMVALLTEFDQAVKAGKNLNGAGKANVLMRARRLTQTQNSLDQFGYQSSANPFQLMFQFVQHVNKIFLDISVEPYVKTFTGLGFKEGRQSIYAENYWVAARTVAFTSLLFGMNGLPIGSDNARKTTNYFRESIISMMGEDILTDDQWFAVQGGLINLMTYYLIGDKVEVTGRVSPSAWVDMFTGMFDNGFSMDVLGAFGGFTGTVWDIAYANTLLLRHPNIDTYDKAKAIVKNTYGLFGSFRDVEKAYIAYNMLNHPYNNTMSGNLRVSQEQALMLAFSFNADQVQERFVYADFGGKKEKDLPTKVSEVFIKEMNRELTSLKVAGNLDSRSAIETMQKWSEYAKFYVEPGQYDEVIKMFKRNMITVGGSGYENFIRPYLEGTSFEQQRLSLMRLRDRLPDERWKEVVDDSIEKLNNILEDEK